MCEPTTIMMGVALGATVIGGMQQAQAAQHNANIQASQANYAAGVARNNQIAASYAAKDAIERGKIARAQAAIQTRQTVGAQRAAFGAAGVDANAGSALALQQETRDLGAYEEAVAMNNAQREALGFTTQASNFGGDVSLHSSAAGNALVGGKLEAQSALVDTAGSVASKWYNFKR